MKKKYKFRKGYYGNSNNDAQVIGEFLELAFPTGKPSNKELVEISRNPKTPTHKYFDWDDKTAAEKYRLDQARFLISSLIVETIEGKDIRAYEYVYVKELDKNTYVDTDQISQDEQLWEQVIAKAKQELEYWKLKYNIYREHFPRIFEAIEEVTDLTKGVSNGKVKTNTNRTTRTSNKNTSYRNKNSTNNY